MTREQAAEVAIFYLITMTITGDEIIHASLEYNVGSWNSFEEMEEDFNEHAADLAIPGASVRYELITL